MNAFISYDFASMYRGIFLPFTNDAFGPELATLLLLLALLVLLIFLFATVPKAFRLRSALATINGKVGTGAESQNRALFKTTTPRLIRLYFRNQRRLAGISQDTNSSNK
jgi:hypothetical protein